MLGHLHKHTGQTSLKNNNIIITNMTTTLILLTPCYTMMTPLIYVLRGNSSCIHTFDSEIGYI